MRETNGTPQGGNLSPLLSNIMLNELDKELEARGLRFTRYADDCVIAVKSETVESAEKRQWGLQKLGVGKDLARLTAYCGDRYYWVATKTCVARAISKGVLARAGLISCLDYYNERHALKLC